MAATIRQRCWLSSETVSCYRFRTELTLSLNGISSLETPDIARKALTDAVCEGHPVIVTVQPVASCVVQFGLIGGHYVGVVTVQEAPDRNNPTVDPNHPFGIVDPGCTNGTITNLGQYEDFYRIRGFVSDPTDVSTLELVVDDGADLLITDGSGKSTGF